jgi:hypothetical protein
LLPAGRIDPTGRQERDVRAWRLWVWVDSLVSMCFVLFLSHIPIVHLAKELLDRETVFSSRNNSNFRCEEGTCRLWVKSQSRSYS